jgi:hypothetical protein
MMLRRCGLLVALVFLVGVPRAEAQCTATVTPTNVSVLSIGSTSALSVISGTSCTWTATSAVGWITITSATGSGIGQVNYTVAANTTGVVRTGTLLVAGQTVTFTQAANSCSYTISPTSVSVPSIGSTSALSVTTGSSCSWSASSTVSWITVTSATGAGVGQVNYTVAANTAGVVRTGALLVAGQSVTFTPAAAPTCSYTVAPTAIAASAAAQTYAISVTSGTNCSWAATSSASWITVASGATGSGSGSVTIAVAIGAATARTGTLTVAGQAVTVTQAALIVPSAPTNLRIIR